jgi:hypothetical protein
MEMVLADPEMQAAQVLLNLNNVHLHETYPWMRISTVRQEAPWQYFVPKEEEETAEIMLRLSTSSSTETAAPSVADNRNQQHEQQQQSVSQKQCIKMFHLPEKFRYRDARRKIVSSAEANGDTFLMSEILTNLSKLPHNVSVEVFANRLLFLCWYTKVLKETFAYGNLYENERIVRAIQTHCTPRLLREYPAF